VSIGIDVPPTSSDAVPIDVISMILPPTPPKKNANSSTSEKSASPDRAENGSLILDAKAGTATLADEKPPTVSKTSTPNE